MIERYRQEHKFLISRQNMDLLKHRLRLTLGTDPHADKDGGYWIRSLYFDDVERSAFREKIDGIKERNKIRIRFYNFDDSYIILEKKERSNDLCRKTTQPITRSLAERLIAGEASGGGSPLLDEFDTLRSIKGLRPIVLVDYYRYAFSYPVSNVRVTLDSQLCTPIYSTDFFDSTLARYPVFDEDEALIELKYDQFAPQYVTGLLEDVPKVKLAVSKYTKCLAMIDE